jgi:hypothetical protein
MATWDILSAATFVIGGLAALAGFSVCVWRILERTWFDPAWMAARHERLLNDPLYEENWEKWA